MDDPTRRFYDELAGSYHLIFADWERSIGRQAEVLDRIIGEALGPGPKRVLDCAAGIGTQALGLAGRGHDVRATDLSEQAIARLRREAVTRSLTIEASVVDLRELEACVEGQFDVVLACDNALPHLAPDQLPIGIRSIASKLRPGGLFLASLRDYDALREERPPTTPLGVIDDETGRRITFQVWNWAEDGASYQLQQFILHNIDGAWRTECHEVTYWALRRADLTRTLLDAGLVDVIWHEPATSGFYQPIVTGRMPSPD